MTWEDGNAEKEAPNRIHPCIVQDGCVRAAVWMSVELNSVISPSSSDPHHGLWEETFMRHSWLLILITKHASHYLSDTFM